MTQLTECELVTLLELTDTVLSLADMRTGQIFRGATDRAKVDELRSVRAMRKSLARIRRLIEDPSIPVEQLRDRIGSLLPAEEKTQSIASRVRTKLSEDARRTRPLVKQLLKLDLTEAAGGEVTEAMSTLGKLYARGDVELPTDTPTPFHFLLDKAPRSILAKFIADRLDLNRSEGLRLVA